MGVSNQPQPPDRDQPSPTGSTVEPVHSPALAQAAEAARRRLDRRWVEVSDQIVTTVLTARRHTRPLRAAGTTGAVFVSDQVVVAGLRTAVDGAVRGSAVARVDLEVQRDQLVGVVIQLVAQYGTALIPLADEVRTLAQERLATLLGPVEAPVTVSAMHVHFSDVTVDDPNPDPRA